MPASPLRPGQIQANLPYSGQDIPEGDRWIACSQCRSIDMPFKHPVGISCSKRSRRKRRAQTLYRLMSRSNSRAVCISKLARNCTATQSKRRNLQIQWRVAVPSNLFVAWLFRTLLENGFGSTTLPSPRQAIRNSQHERSQQSGCQQSMRPSNIEVICVRRGSPAPGVQRRKVVCN